MYFEHINQEFPANFVYVNTTLFFIRTSNFGAEAERSYFFFRFEAENVLKTFLSTTTQS